MEREGGDAGKLAGERLEKSVWSSWYPGWICDAIDMLIRHQARSRTEVLPVGKTTDLHMVRTEALLPGTDRKALTKWPNAKAHASTPHTFNRLPLFFLAFCAATNKLPNPLWLLHLTLYLAILLCVLPVTRSQVYFADL